MIGRRSMQMATVNSIFSKAISFPTIDPHYHLFSKLDMYASYFFNLNVRGPSNGFLIWISIK